MAEVPVFTVQEIEGEHHELVLPAPHAAKMQPNDRCQIKSTLLQLMF